MARIHFVKKARKDYPAHSIKKGDFYYWWKFRFGGKHFSKKHPRPSQLTQSEYLSAAYGLQEQIEDLEIEDLEIRDDNLEDVAGELRSAADELHTLGSEQEDKIGNMPDSLQDSDTAERLRGRAEACEEATFYCRPQVFAPVLGNRFPEGVETRRLGHEGRGRQPRSTTE